MSAVAVAVRDVFGRAPRRHRIPYLVAFAAAAAGAGLGRAVITTYLPVLLDRIADAPALIGAVMLVNAAAGLAVPLVIGIWSDRLRARGRSRTRPFVWGGSLLAAGGLAATSLGWSSSYLVLALTGAVVYIGLNTITTAHRALVPELFSPEARAKATSAQELALLGGGLLGLAVGGALTALSLWAPFLLAAALLPLLALPTLACVSEERHGGPTRQDSQPLAYYIAVARRPGVRALLLAQWLWVLGYAALPTFFVLYAERELDFAAATASILLAGFGVGAGAATLAAGRITAPRRLGSSLALGVVALAGGLLAVSVSTSLLVVGPALLAASLGFGMVSTLGFPLFSLLIPAGEAGGYTALFFSVRAVASAVALPAAGLAVELTGTYRALFALGGAVTLLALVPLARMGSTPRIRLGRPGRLLALALMILLVGRVVVATPLEAVDRELFRAVNRLGPGPDALWAVFDPHTRNYVALLAFAAISAAVTNTRRLATVLPYLLASALLSWVLLEAIYALFDRPRPEEALGAESVSLNGHSWARLESYPSGHMAITAALAIAFAFAFPRLRHVLWGYVATVAFTRVLFGAHFPLDTVAGIALGVASARALRPALGFADLLADRPAPVARRQPSAAAALSREDVWALMPSYGPAPTRELLRVTKAQVAGLLVVDDGSPDEAAHELAELVAGEGAELLRLDQNRGKGSAVRAGIKHLLAREAPPRAVLVIDADGQHPPDSIPAFLAAAADGELVIGDRLGDLHSMPRLRRLGNLTAQRLLAAVVGHPVGDTQSGMRLLRGRALHELELPEGGYEAETRHLRQALIADVAVVWVPIPTIYGAEQSSFRKLSDARKVLAAMIEQDVEPMDAPGGPLVVSAKGKMVRA
jgi:predicted MFS family arabinose efflux permease